MPAILESPLDIKQGDTYHVNFQLTDSTGAPLDLTGRSALMQLRKGSTAPVALELSTDNGRITLTSGNVMLDVDAVTTAAVQPGKYYFDLQTSLGANVETLLTGRANVVEDFTYDG